VLIEKDTIMEDILTELAKPLSKQDQSFWLAEEHLKKAPEPSCYFWCFGNIGQADSWCLKHYPYH
jgi:hypothetical protein